MKPRVKGIWHISGLCGRVAGSSRACEGRDAFLPWDDVSKLDRVLVLARGQGAKRSGSRTRAGISQYDITSLSGDDRQLVDPPGGAS